MLDEYVRPTACSDCPFNETGDGRHLRDSLSPGRWEGILADLANEMTFKCHQEAAYEENEGEELEHEVTDVKIDRLCAGSVAYQRKIGRVPQAVQVAERLTAMDEGRLARF